ncbi:hypothetical protein [Streptomyces xanthophaeus]|uniref:hypothetical protein n=1 Tax=Streptomyces xanthophaeus TaxID=67385 RepID=UPI000B332D88|nr:hypothetical protein [Streptomyces xanthophaeus]
MDEFTATGLTVERLVAHRSAASMARTHPAEHEKLGHEPGFIAFELRKQGRGVSRSPS